MNQTAYIQLTGRFDPGEEDEGGFVAICEELGISSQGETIDEAMTNLNEAIEEYITALFEAGELVGFLKEHGIEVYQEPPDKAFDVRLSRGEVVSAMVAAFGTAGAAIGR